MLNRIDHERLTKAAEQVLTFAKSQGASSAEVSASISKGFSVTVRMGAVETIEHNNDIGINITVFRDHAVGSTSTTDLSEIALKEAVEAALNIARYTEHDPYNDLADPRLMATRFPDLDLYHPWELTVEQAIESALDCETIARAVDLRLGNSEGVVISTHVGIDAYANSHGFLLLQQGSHHQKSCSLIAKQGDAMQREHEYTLSRNPNLLLSNKTLALEAAQKTLARLGSRSIKTQKVPVIFAAPIARSLFGHFIAAIRGGALYRKASFLLNNLDKAIFPNWLSLEEQPYILSGLASSSFDHDGVQTREKYFVEQGVLKSYCLDSYSARRLGLETTANSGGVHNLIAEGATLDFADLLKTMGTGLLVTDVMGQGVNITTGDYSRGASGFWVENGVIQFPVHEITIAGNLKDMFANFIAMASDVDDRGFIKTGSILVSSMVTAG